MHRLTFLLAWFIFAGACSLRADTTYSGTTGSGASVDNRQPTQATRYIIALQGIFPDNGGGTPVGSVPPDRSQPFIGEIRAVSFNFAPSGWVFCEGQALSMSQNSALFFLIGYTYGGSGATFNLPDLRERAPMGAGQGTGLPNYSLGSVVGAASTTLSVANLPSHTHTLPGGGNSGATGGGIPVDNRQVSLALNFLIAADGEIMIVPFSSIPSGWALCDGSSLSTSTYSYLFNIIHYSFGGSGGNFNLPDLRGRVVVGDDAGQPLAIGTAYGTNSVTLGINDIPAHTHTTPSGNTGSTGGGGFSATNDQPSLALRWVLSPFGSFPVPGSGVSFPCVGELRLIAANTTPGTSLDSGWLVANGALLQIAEYDSLYNVIGTTYGGDGQNTFGLPNFQHTINTSASTANPIGSTFGSDFISINIARLAPHAHSIVLATIIGIQHFANGSAQLTLNGTLGTTWQVDKSDSLPASWSNLGAVNFGTATQMIPDSNPTHVTKRFYYAHDP